ncbi:hypothetical protein BCEN4_590050 [Burkholderia cenocepacia]|nr:hypothetical protein BCEN4_590050 [Burkholderia cenocepacia]
MLEPMNYHIGALKVVQQWADPDERIVCGSIGHTFAEDRESRVEEVSAVHHATSARAISAKRRSASPVASSASW